MKVPDDAGRRRAWDLLDEAFRLPQGEREAFLRRACGGDRELAERLVRALDDSHGHSPTSGMASAQSGSHVPEQSVELEPGTRLHSKYEVLEQVARGGMGTVYRGRHVELGQIVAIKVLNRKGDVELVVHEGRRIAEVDHPSVVRVLDVGHHGGTAFLVLEWLEGYDLREWLTAAGGEAWDAGLDETFAAFRSHRAGEEPVGQLSYWRFVASALRDVAAAVAAAHARGVVHQDVSPKNVVVTGEGRAVLVDFGLSAQVGLDPTAQRSSPRGGTWPYMAPEQRSGVGGHPDLNDIYGLGATLLHLCTGIAPDRSPWPTRGIRRSTQFRGMAGRSFTAPVDLLRIAWKAMCPDPTGRYPTASALADDLDAFLSFRPVSVSAPGPVRLAGLWFRRNPARAAAVLLAPLTLFALGTSGAGAWNEARAAELADLIDQSHELYARLPAMWGLNADPRLPRTLRGHESKGTVRALGELLSLRPEMDSVRFRRALAASLGGDLATTREDLDELARRHPDSYLLSVLRRTLLDPDPDLGACVSTLLEVPSNASAFDHAMAAAVLFACRWPESEPTVRHAQAALQANPDDIATRELLALEVGLTRYEQVPAIPLIDRVVADLGGRETPSTLHLRAFLLDSRDGEARRALWERSLAKHPLQYQARHNLAELDLDQAGFDQGALEDVLGRLEALALERPASVALHVLRVRCLRRLGRIAEATDTAFSVHSDLAPFVASRWQLDHLLLSAVAHNVLVEFHRFAGDEAKAVEAGFTKLRAIAEYTAEQFDEGGPALRAVGILMRLEQGLTDPKAAFPELIACVAEAQQVQPGDLPYAAEAALLCLRELPEGQRDLEHAAVLLRPMLALDAEVAARTRPLQLDMFADPASSED